MTYLQTFSQRILLADPDEQLLDEYRGVLSEAGFQVATATNGLKCLEYLKHFEPHLLVMEPMIPWGQGEGILSLMREESGLHKVPVILLTCGTDLLEDYQLPRFPVLERHQKPLSAAKLLECVKHLTSATAEH